MHKINIPDFQFDSLVDWSSTQDILDTFPFLTLQQATLASRFHGFNTEAIKAALIYNIIYSMFEDNDELSNDQILFIAELLNWDRELKDDIIKDVNTLSDSVNYNIHLQEEQ